MGKLLIRKDIRNLHGKLTQERREAAARDVFDEIESMEQFHHAHVIAIYHALADEIPTIQTIDRWSKMGKILLLPRVDGESMEFYRVDRSELGVGSFGIVEPQGDEAIDPEMIELMVVPGMAFCADGRRLGRGKGYYDRYLARCNKSLYKIGISFSYQLVDDIPCDKNDVNMDCVCLGGGLPQDLM